MNGVCDNQNDFNKAVRSALKYNMKEDVKKSKPWVYIYLALYLVFFVWAIMLAMQMNGSHAEKIEHLVFAILFSPVYVLAYYLCMMGKSDGGSMSAGFGMCGRKY
jgi:hypothetical protein